MNINFPFLTDLVIRLGQSAGRDPELPPDDAPLPIRRWVARDLHRYNASAQIVTPNTEFSNMFLTEAARGCGQGCRFCFAGYAYRPVRYAPEERINAAVARNLRARRAPT